METGRGGFANPASLLRAAAMLLRHIARSELAAKLDDALNAVGDKPREMTAVDYTDKLIACIQGK